MCPGDPAVKLPVYWDEDVAAISFPVWDTESGECDRRGIEQYFLFMPVATGTAQTTGGTSVVSEGSLQAY